MTMKWAPQSKAVIPYVVLAALLLGLLIPAVLLPYSAAAIEVPTPTGCAPGDQACEALMKEMETAQASQKTQRAAAFTAVTCNWDEISCGILMILNWILDGVIYVVFPLGESFLNAMITYSFDAFQPNSQFLPAARIGFSVVLGITNLFFVLLLLWIAIATIFDFQPFTARQLLPSLIIAALLINFSFAIGSSIINLSNGIAGIFVTRLNTKKEAGGMGGVANAISAIFSPEAITLAIQNKYVSLNKEEAEKFLKETTKPITGLVPAWLNRDYTAKECYNIVNRRPNPVLSLPGDAFDFLFETVTGYQTAGAYLHRECSNFISDAKISKHIAAIDPNYGKLTLLAGALAAKAAVAPIALFAVFAAGILLLVRLISLLLLLVFGPLAFFFMALPATRHYYTDWWQKLFRWSFFFPAFSFLFMLAFIIIQKTPVAQKELILAGQKIPDVAALFVNYLIGIGVLIAALMVGNQMSIYGASTVTGWGKKMGRGVGRWTAGRGWKYAGRATGAAMGTRVGAVAARIPILGAGVRAGAAAVIKKGAGVEKKDIEFYNKLSNRELARQFGSRAIPPHLRQAIYRSFNNTRRREFAAEAQRQNINLQDLVGTATRRQQLFPVIFGRPPPVIAPPPPPAPPPTQAQLLQIQNQAIQTQVMQNLQGVLAQFPQQVQNAFQQAVQQAVQNLPLNAQQNQVTQAVNQAIQTTVQAQPAGLAQVQVQAAFQAQPAQQQIQATVTQAVQAAQQAVRQARAAPAPPAQTAEEFREEVEGLRSELEEEREERRRGQAGA